MAIPPCFARIAKCLLILAFVLSACVRREPPGEAQCPEVAQSGHLNVLTINLLAVEIESRDARLADIAQFVADSRVDVILLQEVVGGRLAKTDDSAQDLRAILRDEHSLTFERRRAIEFAIPKIFSVGNAILSRCQVRFHRVKRLPAAPEEVIDDLEVDVPRNVLLLRLDVPGFGGISVYDTHLCARCPVPRRLEQLNVLLSFLESAEADSAGNGPVVFGGDLNVDIFRDDEAQRPLYDRIISEGFVDAYAVGRTLTGLCEAPRAADEHCTVGVSDLDGNNSRRIDYVFVRGLGGAVRESRVVFNPAIQPGEPTVSDHAGVFISVELP